MLSIFQQLRKYRFFLKFLKLSIEINCPFDEPKLDKIHGEERFSNSACINNLLARIDTSPLSNNNLLPAIFAPFSKVQCTPSCHCAAPYMYVNTCTNTLQRPDTVVHIAQRSSFRAKRRFEPSLRGWVSR